MAAVVRSPISIHIEGLKEFIAASKAVDPALAREMSSAFRVAARLVKAGATAEAQSVGGVAAHAAPGIKASGTIKGASIRLDTESHPEIMGAEFGGGSYGAQGIRGRFKSPGHGHTSQFKPWRGRGADAGYFVYPTIRKEGPEIERLVMAAVEGVFDKLAFPD